MKAVYEEGTELVVDSETLTLTAGWSDAGASTVSRHGDTVTVSLHLTPTARDAWKEKEKYALGSIVTEGGKTYVLIKAEPEAEKSKPTTDAGVHWQEVAAPLTVMTLPGDFRPTVELLALGESAGAPVKIASDGTIKADNAGVVEVLAVYVAAGVSP